MCTRISYTEGDNVKTILITGGSGFIGTHVTRILLDRGMNVIVYDLEPCTLPRASYVKGNILDSELLQSAMKECDGIVHLAAQISVPRSIEKPDETFEINVIGTQNILDVAEKLGVSRVILASSAAVYGDETDIPLREMKVGNQLSPYGSSKFKNEEQVLDARSKGIEAVALRFFNVYGPNQKIDGAYAAVIPNMIHRIMSGESPVVYGDGMQTRDFIHVRDVAMSIYNMLSTDWERLNSHVYNVASQQQTSILDLINVIHSQSERLGLYDSPISPVFENERFGDVKHSVADIDQIKNDLQWQPEVEFSHGIAELLLLRRASE